MGYTGEYNQAMKPRIEGTGHGKEQAVSSGGIHERVFHRGKMPGVYGKFAVGGRICLPQMRLPPRLPAIQWSVSMCRMPQATLSDSGNGASKEPYAADTVVSGILLCQSGQAGHLRRCADVDAGNDL